MSKRAEEVHPIRSRKSTLLSKLQIERLPIRLDQIVPVFDQRNHMLPWTFAHHDTSYLLKANKGTGINLQSRKSSDEQTPNDSFGGIWLRRQSFPS